MMPLILTLFHFQHLRKGSMLSHNILPLELHLLSVPQVNLTMNLIDFVSVRDNSIPQGLCHLDEWCGKEILQAVNMSENQL